MHINYYNDNDDEIENSYKKLKKEINNMSKQEREQWYLGMMVEIDNIPMNDHELFLTDIERYA